MAFVNFLFLWFYHLSAISCGCTIPDHWYWNHANQTDQKSLEQISIETEVHKALADGHTVLCRGHDRT